MDKIPIWLKYVSQNIPITKPKTTIIELALLIDKEEGIKFISVYWDGIKFAIKFVDVDAMIINIKAKFGGVKALFSGEGAFLLEASGNGDLFFNSFGGIIEKEINGEFIVDTGHVVGFEPTLNYKISGMGNWKSTMLSGEGLVMTFNGTGKIYLQTRTIDGIASWLTLRLIWT